MPFFPVFRRWEGGHDTFTCRIVYSVFFSDWSTNNTLKRCVLIACHISTKLPVKKSVRRKQMADTERGFSGDEFSTSLAEALRYFKYDSLKVGQIERLRRVICLREDVLAVLPTGFGKSLLNLPSNSKGVRVFEKRRRRHKKLSSALSAHWNTLENSKWQVSTNYMGYPQLPLATMRKLTKIEELKIVFAVQNSGA